MAEHKLVDGVKVVLTDAEIAQRQAEEQAWLAGAFDRSLASLRAKRNSLLKDSDYTVLQDSVLTSAKKSEWMVYRTNLRNITQGLTTVEQVNAVVFPIRPQN
jgi:hypothetical protein